MEERFKGAAKAYKESLRDTRYMLFCLGIIGHTTLFGNMFSGLFAETADSGSSIFLLVMVFALVAMFLSYVTAGIAPYMPWVKKRVHELVWLSMRGVNSRYDLRSRWAIEASALKWRESHIRSIGKSFGMSRITIGADKDFKPIYKLEVPCCVMGDSIIYTSRSMHEMISAIEQLSDSFGAMRDDLLSMQILKKAIHSFENPII